MENWGYRKVRRFYLFIWSCFMFYVYISYKLDQRKRKHVDNSPQIMPRVDTKLLHVADIDRTMHEARLRLHGISNLQHSLLWLLKKSTQHETQVSHTGRSSSDIWPRRSWHHPYLIEFILVMLLISSKSSNVSTSFCQFSRH